MCEWCNQDPPAYCEDCGRLLCQDMKGLDDVMSGPYITSWGDLFCLQCGPSYDRLDEEEMDNDLDFGWEYPEDWYDASSPLSELEPEETPRTKYIGPGSECEPEAKE